MGSQGGYGDGDANWNGKIAELIVVSDALSDSDRQKLEGYLAHKWGLHANLPVGHPYTNEAPVSVGLAVATLDATVSDLSGDSVTQVWTKIGGPVSPVDFGDASAVDTTATFYEVGVYTLRLTADDGLGQSSDQVEITVTLPHLTVSILAASISERGSTTAIISRLGTVGDLTVNLSSNDPGEATVPATATIPNGFNSVVVTITGVVDGIIDGSETVTITATAAGHAPGSDTVDVTHESGSVFRFR